MVERLNVREHLKVFIVYLYLRSTYTITVQRAMRWEIVYILTTVLGIGVRSSEGTLKAWVVEPSITVESDAQLCDVCDGEDRNTGATVPTRE